MSEFLAQGHWDARCKRHDGRQWRLALPFALRSVKQCIGDFGGVKAREFYFASDHSGNVGVGGAKAFRRNSLSQWHALAEIAELSSYDGWRQGGLCGAGF